MRVKKAVTPASAGGDGELGAESPEEEDSEVAGLEGGGFGRRQDGEDTTSIGAALRAKQGAAGTAEERPNYGVARVVVPGAGGIELPPVSPLPGLDHLFGVPIGRP